eukprot:m.41035 g.41035  ORF g.41035 m.41035 type:complete len:301 (-) comp12800_c0_seq2:72-974(-)
MINTAKVVMPRNSIGSREGLIVGLIVVLLVGFLVLRPVQEEAQHAMPKPVAVQPAEQPGKSALPAVKPKAAPKTACTLCAHDCEPNQAIVAGEPTPEGCCSVTCKSVGTAPASFTVRFETTKGDFEAEFHKAWAPVGVQRIFEMVESGFFNNGIAFFRNVPRFIVQFGIHGTPKDASFWRGQHLIDDPVTQSNDRGTVTFATAGMQATNRDSLCMPCCCYAGKNTRTTQLFINFGNNHGLDGQGFSPLGKVTKGMESVVDKLSSEHGEKPNQGLLQARGNAYLKEEFQGLDYITKAMVVR